MVSLQPVSPLGSYYFDKRLDRNVYIPKAIGQRVKYQEGKQEKIGKVLWFTMENALILPVKTPESEMNYEIKSITVPIKNLTGDAVRDKTKVAMTMDYLLESFDNISMLKTFNQLKTQNKRDINQTQAQYETFIMLDAFVIVTRQIKEQFKIPDEDNKLYQAELARNERTVLLNRLDEILMDSSPFNYKTNRVNFELILKCFARGKLKTKLPNAENLNMNSVSVLTETLNNLLGGSQVSPS